MLDRWTYAVGMVPSSAWSGERAPGGEVFDDQEWRLDQASRSSPIFERTNASHGHVA